MTTLSGLQLEYAKLVDEGTRLAGGLTDLAQRAAVYHHLFEHSGRNHVFPAIAAHGALWAGGWFRLGLNIGSVLSWQFAFSPGGRSAQQEQLARFANSFREINRRVCVDTYASYHFTTRFGKDPLAAQIIRPELLTQLNRLHAARGEDRELQTQEKRDLFAAHFLDEQERVVGPAVEQAVADFDWPLMKAIALRPLLRFSFFPRGKWFVFRSFDNRQERIDKGLLAFDYAAEAGGQALTDSLRDYATLPESFFAGPARHFESLLLLLLPQPQLAVVA